ncbi:phycobiliprotein lyase [Pleurocapsales cyanobacterium LEGE 06147]|nr:phycobiliprotein lyase [Pleurocapsales cyanobacterium LEGE 06147]
MLLLNKVAIDCVGKWTTERTYHYLSEQEVERSRTEFSLRPLTSEQKQKVLTDNAYGEVLNNTQYYLH